MAQQLSQEVRARKVYAVKEGHSIMGGYPKKDPSDEKEEVERFHLGPGSIIERLSPEDVKYYLSAGVIEQKLIEV
jgi:hypothetical protein